MSEVPTGMLGDTLRGRAATAPSPECLDAETVAAWADDTLTRQERAAAEAHAADCARCQAVTAAMARTAPPTPARSWWRMPALGWLVPLTAAVAALLVYVNVPYRARSIVDDRGAPAKTEALAAAPTPAAPAPSAADAARERKADVKPVNQLAAAKAAPGVSVSASADVTAPLERAAPRRDAEPRARRDSKAPAPAQANAIAAAKDTASPTPAAPPLAAPSPAPIAAPPPTQAESVAPPSTAAVVLGLSARAPAGMMLKVQEPQPIISPSPNTRWRIVTGGGVERSTDGGSTWVMQPTGVTVTLTAGASPSPTTCWLVGPGGIVLLSTDGRSWQRIAFPEATDLSSVRATDDRTATVTTSDGRALTTTDRGLNWTR